MRITQWGEYATHFCILLAQNEAEGKSTTPASEIARMHEVDILYVQQILQRLRRSNIIESVRGPQGGYKISRSPSTITLKDILIAAEGDTFELICETKPIDSGRCAPQAHCALRSIWHQLKDHVDSFLAERTLSDLAQNTGSVSFISHIGKNSGSENGGGTSHGHARELTQAFHEPSK